jgi:hypothetical protein
MLSSQSALRDCREFYPRLANDVSVVRFATQPAPGLLTANPPDVLAHYGLPPAYFYLPNQFWRHKNHQLGRRVDRSKKRSDVVVVASGGVKIPRTDYLKGMMRESKVKALNEFPLFE